MISKYPKVLIIGEVFKQNSGGGITLSNLFRDWPSKSLAVISERSQEADGNVCNDYYHLGSTEIKVKFPLTIFFPLQPSGAKVITHKEVAHSRMKPAFTKRVSLKNILKPVYHFMRGFTIALLHRAGLFHSFTKVCLSEDIKEYIDRFSPEVIYCQIFSFNTINLIKQLKKYRNYPLVIHIMDDFPNIIIKRGLGSDFWKNKLDKEFKDIISMANVCLSISDGMSEEYKKRYLKDFIPFRNPVDLSFWNAKLKDSYMNTGEFVILYAGRLGAGIDVTLQKVAASVDKVNEETKYKITFLIQSNRYPEWKVKFKHTEFSPFVEYNKLPALFSSVDLLLLPYDFSGTGLVYIQYSMPTKVSEYMASGSPILIVSPESTALYSYARKNDFAFIVKEDNIESIKRSIIEIFERNDLRLEKAGKAIEIVKKDSDSILVREKFLNTIKSAIKD